MIRVDIESIIMASGPVPSVVVLRERKPGSATEAPLRALSIQTGAYEAACIGHGSDLSKQTQRPIAHDLLLNAVKELGGKVERVEINRWDPPVYFADVILSAAMHACGAEGEPTPHTVREIRIDARPCDALALATRANAPIYVEDDVMNRAGSISYQPASPEKAEEAAAAELERFDEFVQTLSPDDF